MKSKSGTTAQRLINLYRQQHVIFGGWKAVNQIFMTEADADVIAELKNLPSGQMLVQHIANLQSGKTPIDSIEQDLIPYDGTMLKTVASTYLSESEIQSLRDGLAEFTPDSDGIARLRALPVVQKFGDEWLVAVRSALFNEHDLLEKWNIVTKTARAYYLWKVANDILAAPISERARAQVQADLPEYETYLPMFGDAGNELLSRLRIFVSSL